MAAVWAWCVLAWQRVAEFLRPTRTGGCRDMVMLFCVVQGAARLLWDPGSNQPVNLLPSWLYGALMLGVALALLVTRSCERRASYAGRIVAVAAMSLWLLLALDIIASPISFGNAIVVAIVAANEARFRDC